MRNWGCRACTFGVVSRLNGGMFVCHPLQFDDDQGKAVDQEHDVGNALSHFVLHLQLVHDRRSFSSDFSKSTNRTISPLVSPSL